MSDYTPSGAPVTSSSGSSSAIRAEFALIQTAIASKADSAGPTLTTPALGAATATSINKITLTQPATGATLTLTDGKTLSVAKTLTLTGTDGTTMTFPATSASVARIDAAQTFTGIQDFDGRIDANAGLAVTGANFTSRGITDTATAVALTLSGSGANSVTIANSATNPTIGTSAGSLDFNPVGQGISLRVSTGGASTVNSLQVAGGTTGNRITVLANGSDTNVGASWQTKGSGTHLFVTETGASAQVEITHTASAVRYLTLTGAIAGGNPTIGTSAGSLALVPANGVADVGNGTTAETLNLLGTGSGIGGGARIQLSLGGSVTIALGNKSALIGGAYDNVGLLTSYYDLAIAALGADQVRIVGTTSADRYITLTGANAANPKIATSAGSLDIGSPVVFTSQTVGTTVGAAGGASALPATPLGYLTTAINGTACKIPYYTA